MANTDYASLNVTVRLREQNLLTATDYDNLMNSNDFNELISQLNQTSYDVPENLEETQDYDEFLMDYLKQAYDMIYQFIPDQRVVDLFGLRYSYHNAKILFKEEYSNRDFSSMYIDLGPYHIDSILHAVQTGESPVLDDHLLRAIQLVRDYVKDTEQINDVSIMLDDAYLSHMGHLAEEIGDHNLQEWVVLFINLENLSLLLRGIQQERSSAFLRVALNESGSIPVDNLVAWAENRDFQAITDAYEGHDLGEEFRKHLLGSQDQIISGENSGQLTFLEDVINTLLSEKMREAQLHAFGPMPVLSYLYFLETEVTNLRLIFVGKGSQVNEDKIKERMRPIYDK